MALPAASVPSIFERASEFNLIVPSDSGPICQRWTVEGAARPKFDRRMIMIVQDLQGVKSRRPVRLRIAWNDKEIAVFDPRANVPGTQRSGIDASLRLDYPAKSTW